MRDLIDALFLSLMLAAGWLVVSLARFGSRVDRELFEEGGVLVS